MIIFSNILFIISYIFFVITFYNNTNKIIYPVYLYPLAVYSLLLFAVIYLNKIWDINFKYLLKKFSLTLFVFLGFFLTPLMIKINLPEPHNFLQRKLELIGGIFYSTFILAIFLFLFFELKNKYESKLNDIKFILVNIFILLFTFYFYISLWFNYANQPTGDEPIYLLVSHSIVYDRDLDLKNNYENKDYKNFYLNKELELQELDIKIDDKLYSFHPVLYSVIISPFYFLGKRIGVTIFSNILTALYVIVVFLFIYKILNNKQVAILLSFICGFSMPVIMYSNQICTEMLNGFLIIISFYLILYKKEKFLLLSFITMLIPWAHPRNLLIWISLILIYIIENRNEIIKILKFISAQIISLVIFFVFNFINYKVLIPRYVKHNTSYWEAFKLNANGFLGHFLDQEFGIIFYTPIFIFLLAGIYFFYKENKRLFFYSIIIFLPYYLLISTWLAWSGSGASNRYFVPIIFIFYFWLVPLFYKLKDIIIKKILYFLIYLGFFISYVIMLVPWFRWNKGLGQNWILKFLSEFTQIDFTIIFPSYWAPTQNILIQTIIWIFLIIIINFILIKKIND